MKALKSTITLKAASAMALAFVLFVSSCKKDNELLSTAETQSLNSESVSESYTDEANDMSSIAVTGVPPTSYSGRTEGDVTSVVSKLDDRLKCATINITLDPTSQPGNPKGVIVIDFGTGCTDSRGITRKGKINISYSGPRWVVGSKIVSSFDNYFRNAVKIEGTHTLTVQPASQPAYYRVLAEVANGKLTFG
ncbi:MAG: hypothetical protein ACKOE6_09105, partial [Flammeovirgaceae bacterium]